MTEERPSYEGGAVGEMPPVLFEVQLKDGGTLIAQRTGDGPW